MAELPVLRVVGAEIQRDGHYLLTRRPAHAVLPGLWEFPGGRVQDGESDAAALRRCLEKRVNTDVDVGERVLELHHDYDDYRVVFLVYQARIVGPEPTPGSVAELAWVPPAQFGDYTFPDADRRTVELLVRADD